MLANDYRIVVRDLNLPIGFEHYVIAVEKNINGTWIPQLEMNGLATSSSGTSVAIGSTLTGHGIQSYITGGSFDGNFSISNLSQLTGISQNSQIFQGKYIGYKGNVYDFNYYPDGSVKNNDLYFLKKDQNGHYINNIDPASDNILFTGTEYQALQAVSGMLKAGNAINTTDYSYQIPFVDNVLYHTQNSNRTAFTLIEAGMVATGGVGFRDDTLDSITRWDAPGSGESFDLGSDFWKDIAPTKTELMPYAPVNKSFNYINLNDLNAMGINVESDPYTIQEFGDDVYYVFEQGAKITIDAVEYTADAVVGAVDSATKGLSEFLFDNDALLGNSFNEALDGALYATLGKMASLMISGQNIDMAEMFKIMAKEIGYKFTSNVITKTEMGTELSTYIDTKLGMNGYGKAAVGVLVEFGLRAVIDGKNWDADDYIKNASIAIVNAVTPIVVAHNVSSLSNGAGGLSQAGGAVVAAITTIVTALITDPKMNSGEYAMLYVQANIAATSYAIGAALAPASFGLSIIISAVAAAVMNEVVGELYWGKKFNAGEFQTRNAAEDALWRFAHITVKDANNKDITADAVYSFGVDGQTLNYADIVGRDNFRVIENADFEAGKFDNPTVLGKGGFKPTYYVGVGKTSSSLGADNIVASSLNDTIIGNTGSDYLDAKGGSNTIFGDGNTETSNDGNDVILAGAVNINGDALESNNIISAGGGDDYVSVTGRGNNTIMLGSGHDRAYTADSNDIIVGGGGEDYIEAGHGNNKITLGNTTYDITSETIKSDDDFSENEVYTGHGNDIISGSAGNDIIISDVMTQISKSVIVENKQNNYRTDSISAGSGNDLIMAGLGNDTVYGDAGDDVIIGGGAGDDVVGAGTQLSDGTFVNDLSVTTFYDNDLDQIWGGSGNDIIIADTMIDGTDQYSVNTLLIDNSLGDTNNYLSGTQSTTQQSGTIENDYVDGGIGNDFIYAGGGNDKVVGGLGSDIIFGGRGDDDISGDEGVDYIVGDASNDTLDGGLSDDFYFFRNIDGTDTIKNTQDRDRIVFAENSFAELVFKRSGNNLEITNGGGTKVIVENHFAGNSMCYLYDKQNKVYSLNGLVGNSGDILNPLQLNGTWTNPVTTLNALSQEHEQNFADATSPFAVNESSSWYEQNYYTEAKRSVESETINGVQVGFTKRKRGIFGGYYNVFYQIKNQNLVGKQEGSYVGTVADDGQKETVAEIWDNYYTGSPKQWYEILSNDDSHFETNDEFNDLIVGAYWSETVNGLDGDDAIFAGVGEDIVTGGDGNDFAYGGDDADIMYGDGSDAGKDGIIKLRFNDHYEAYYILKETETNHDLLFGGTDDDKIYGEVGNDTLNGDSGNDTIDGGTGDDNSEGNSGNDIINDMIGNAIINGGSGDDTINTGDGFDLLRGGSGIDLIKAGGANDTIFGGDNTDILYGETGHDLIYGGYGDDFINGDSGNDILIGGYGNDKFYGGLDNDKSYGGSGGDTFYGETGADMYNGGSDTDTVSYYDSTDAGVIIDLDAGKAIEKNSAGATLASNSIGDYYFSIEAVRGTQRGDFLYGDVNNNILYGEIGNDRLYGRDGNDTLLGGVGQNYLDGGNDTDAVSYRYMTEAITVDLRINSGIYSASRILLDSLYNIENIFGSNYNDNLVGNIGDNTVLGLEGNDRLFGVEGNDKFLGGNGADYLSGGSGYDTTDYADSLTAVTVNLMTNKGVGGTAELDTYNSIENANGSNYNDALIGNNDNNYLYGGGGNDIFIGGLGADTFDGYSGYDTVNYQNALAAVNVDFSKATGYSGEAAGDSFKSIENFIGSKYNDIFKGNISNNIIYSSLGSDKVDGYSGIDNMNYSNSTSGVSVFLDGVTAGINGYAAGDILISIENIDGSNYGDTLTGTVGTNLLSGMGGNDTIRGGIGTDSLYGGTGNDSLFGDDDNDYIYGDVGTDIISGGNGTDTMIYMSSLSGITIRLDGTAGTGGDALGDKLYSIENIYGSAYNDGIVGTNGDNYLRGYDGIDRIFGIDGNDKIIGGKDADFINGGNDIDTVSYIDSSSAVIAYLNDVTTEASAKSGIGGAAQDDKIIYVENLDGSQYDDTLYGNLQNNILTGQAGDDVLYGYAGLDTLNGGLGSDTLSGGSNSDSFVYNSMNDSFDSSFDIITDFTSGSDKIMLNFDVNIADILITTVSGYKNISITDTDFFIRINNNITLNDIALI